MDDSLRHTKGYVQYEYIQKELPDLFALCDLVISRAGANAVCEFLKLQKPMLLIPLSARASRGDQILNARSFERQGFSMVLEEEELTRESLLHAVSALSANREDYIRAMRSCMGLSCSTRVRRRMLSSISLCFIQKSCCREAARHRS